MNHRSCHTLSSLSIALLLAFAPAAGGGQELSCFTEPSSQDPLLDQSLTSPYLDRASSALVNLHVHLPPKLFNPQTDMRFTWPPGGQDRLDHTLPSGVYIARLRTALPAGDRIERRVTTPSIRSEAHMAASASFRPLKKGEASS